MRYIADGGQDRLLIVNLGIDLPLVGIPEPLLAPPVERKWRLLWSSEDPKYGGDGTPLPKKATACGRFRADLRCCSPLKAAGPVIEPIRITPIPGEAPLAPREWLVTNGLGGFASATIAGGITRRYHGLLIAALPPPHGRMVVFNDLELFIERSGESAVSLHEHGRFIDFTPDHRVCRAGVTRSTERSSKNPSCFPPGTIWCMRHSACSAAKARCGGGCGRTSLSARLTRPSTSQFGAPLTRSPPAIRSTRSSAGPRSTRTQDDDVRRRGRASSSPTAPLRREWVFPMEGGARLRLPRLGMEPGAISP